MPLKRGATAGALVHRAPVIPSAAEEIDPPQPRDAPARRARKLRFNSDAATT